jgi:hypothetical protein
MPEADANGRPTAGGLTAASGAAHSGFDHSPSSIEHDRNWRQHDVVTAILTNVDAREDDG